MVRIAVAGGTGNVATEILRAPIASGHEISILTRSPPTTRTPGVTYKTVDYTDLAALTTALRGFDVCLSFLVVHLDTDCTAQKNLIHASIAAGVKRFAPSEWGIKNGSDVPPYANKDAIAGYLEELKAKGELGRMQYCLFQPSIFMDYFAHPRPLSPGLITWPFFVDFERRRAMVLDGGEQPIVLTAIADISAVLDLALSDTDVWPAVGGMRGARTSINELLSLGKKLRGGEWSVEHVRGEDIERGVLTASWVPIMSHPVIPQDDREAFSREFVIMFFKGIMRGAWDVSAEWNEKFPGYKFTGLEEYLSRAWDGRA
ncbi:NmrA-like family protein-like protein [Karstenula rhodostoma CBS 690.94]|uniref:NmrA-like family protein-like protein n=1 Tax=Karstenula rhodostoma CBS 690.94 TaxID=1392251 RepID=A0A9P4U9Z2_9PLEO|nr:NmrA-like family protein-like protein [Karstenula rhodostoma CBS 690.94]